MLDKIICKIMLLLKHPCSSEERDNIELAALNTLKFIKVSIINSVRYS